MSETHGTTTYSLPDEAHRVLEVCEPYLLASPFGAAGEAPHADIGRLHRLDPLRVASGEFVSRVDRLQSRALAPRGLTIPRWALFDCGEVPGAVFGFARSAGDGLTPVSLVVAIPLLEPGAWHVYALCAEDPAGVLPQDVLRVATLSMALPVLGAARASAVVPWRGDDLHAYARLAPLALVTAWTPAHSNAASFTCRFDAHGAHEEADRRVDLADDEALQAIQREIESGARFEITGPPRVERGRTTVPLRGVTK